jgi:hypothetical protein
MFISLQHLSDFWSRTADSISALFEEKKANNEAFSKMADILRDNSYSYDDMKPKEDVYFEAVGRHRQDLATEITLVSKMSKGFIADVKLWRRAEEALGPLDHKI